MRHPRWTFWGALLLLVGCLGCSAGGEGPPDAGHFGAPDAGPHADADGGADGGCRLPVLLDHLGRHGLLVGGEVEDATAAAAPIDIRYEYLAGGLPDDSIASFCASVRPILNQPPLSARSGVNSLISVERSPL